MRRTLLDVVTKRTSALGARVTYTPTDRPVLVNLGAGATVAPGWINVDASMTSLAAALPEPLLRLAVRYGTARRWMNDEELISRLKSGVFRHADIAKRLPLPDECADAVYTGHTLEHLYREDSERLLREILRVLKRGGVVRINVPSLEEIIKFFEEGNSEAALDHLFPRSKEEKAKGGWLGQHRYLYDWPLLKRLLEEAGFGRVHQRRKGEGSVPDLDLLERRSPRGLYVEAVKAL